MNKDINTCKECKSDYFTKTSKKENFCPNCAHYLYGQKECGHRFEGSKRCTQCHWDGTFSERITALIKRNNKKLRKATINSILAIVILLAAVILTIIGLQNVNTTIFSLEKYSFSENITLFLGIFGIAVSVPFLISTTKYKKRLLKESPYMN